MQKLNVRIVSFFLILAFSQKMGLELWLHNWLHETSVTASVGPTQKGKPAFQHQRIKCTCIDDALMPLMASATVDYSPHQQPSISIYATTYTSWLSVDQEFSALRGPPSVIFFSRKITTPYANACL
jgi:hypothetical protein